MIIIFRGIAGSGKTSLIKLLTSGTPIGTGDPRPVTAGTIAIASYFAPLLVQLERHQNGTFSSDDYFVDKETGEYRFDPKYLSTAHAQCLRRFTEFIHENAVRDSKPSIIVDNTNTSITEVAPYAALAGAYNHELHIVTLLCDPAKAWERNTHQVPFTNVVKQDLQLRKSILEWPPWFPQQVFCV